MRTTFPETILKTLEPKISYCEDPENIDCGEGLDKIYQKKTNGIIIGSNCECYNHGKNHLFFSDLEKEQALQSQIRTILSPGKILMKKKRVRRNSTTFRKFFFYFFFKKSLIQDYLEYFKLLQIEIPSLNRACTNM